MRRPLFPTLAFVAGACLRFSPFVCDNDAQCDAEMGGVCQLAGAGDSGSETVGGGGGGWCSYPDDTCNGGLRYEPNAGDGLGGSCIGGEVTTGPTSEGSVGESDATSEPTSGPMTTDPTVASTAATSDTGEDCGAAGQPCCGGDSCADGLECKGSGCGCVAGIASGSRHMCAILLDGSLWCWGANDLGQLGKLDPPFDPLPVQVTVLGANQTVAVSAQNHTCALRDDDIAMCWGDNGSGQSLPSSMEPEVLPTEVTWAQPATLVAAGLSHSCAGREPGMPVVATCWGANGQNQLTSMAPAPGPVDVNFDTDFAEIELGGTHSCARTAAGAVHCWGGNAQGQLAADPATVPTSPTLLAVAIDPAADIAVGRDHSCASTDLGVMCWGRNDSGQLGDGSAMQQNAPVAAALPPEAGDIASLAAGPHHTCALTVDGELWCWGSNDRGQLMLEPDEMGNDAYTHTPVRLVVGASVLAVATGTTHTCAMVDTGEILCWGTNTEGQIGDGGTSYAFSPTPVMLECPA
jgi:alpha-tubulin suppressor-like RCC1 family protein